MKLAISNKVSIPDGRVFPSKEKPTHIIIDEKVKVDDRPALKAILKLKHTTALMDPELWWQLATQRLSLLHTVSSTITNDIITLEKMANKILEDKKIVFKK